MTFSCCVCVNQAACELLPEMTRHLPLELLTTFLVFELLQLL